MTRMEANKVAGMSGMLALLLVITFGCSGNDGDGDRADRGSQVETRPPTLRAQLDSLKNEFMSTAPQEAIETFEAGIAEIRRSGVMDSALKVGDQAPEFELTEAYGKPISLYQLLERTPVVLIFYRGGWCPYCNLQLRAYQEVLPKVKEAGGVVVAISPEIPDSARSTREQNEVGFFILHDNGNEVARKFGIAYKLPEALLELMSRKVDLFAYNMNKSNELPLTATYVIDSDGVIRYAFLEADHRLRAEPEDVVRALQRITSPRSDTISTTGG